MFDDEGFYKIGDAGRFVDPDDPNGGLVFDGRIVEDFKLMSGTFVLVGTPRTTAIAAASPVLQDAVVCGQDRAYVGLLGFRMLPHAGSSPATARPSSPSPISLPIRP